MLSRKVCGPGLAPWLRVFFVSISLVLLGPAGCKKPASEGGPQAYVVDGNLWAYGQVQLTHLEGKPRILVKRKAAGQSLDSQGNRRYSYDLFGRQELRSGGTVQRELAYIDYHPRRSRLLAYAYSLRFEPSARQRSMVRIYAMLRMGGPSFYGRQKVYLGHARFQDGKNEARVEMANLRGGKRLKLSRIADGVYTGQWALHYANADRITVKPWNGVCRRSVSQIPGQVPTQTPSQNRACRKIPAQVDLCQGNPAQKDCRPPKPSQTPGAGTRVGTRTENLTVVEETENVYVMERKSDEAKLVFQSEGLGTDIGSNAEVCAEKFYAVGRTSGGEVNPACQLTPAPAEAVDGNVACAVKVEFKKAETYMEKICNVTATFLGAETERTTAQVLKR